MAMRGFPQLPGPCDAERKAHTTRCGPSPPKILGRTSTQACHLLQGAVEELRESRVLFSRPKTRTSPQRLPSSAPGPLPSVEERALNAELCRATTAAEVLRLADPQHPGMSDFNVACTLSRLARLAPPARDGGRGSASGSGDAALLTDPRFRSLMACSRNRLGGMQPSDLSASVAAVAALGVEDAAWAEDAAAAAAAAGAGDEHAQRQIRDAFAAMHWYSPPRALAQRPRADRRAARPGRPSQPKRRRPTEEEVALNRSLVGATTSEQVLRLANPRAAGFSDINLSTGLHRLARLAQATKRGGRSRDPVLADARFRSLVALSRKRLPAFEGRNVSNSVWALAALGVEDAGWMDDAVAVLRPMLPRLDSRNIAMLMWSLASMPWYSPPPSLLPALISQFQARLLDGETNSHSFSNAVWALGTMGRHPGDGWLHAFAAAVQPRLGEFLPQELASTLWGCASLAFRPPPAWMAAFQAAVLLKLAVFDRQALANTHWAMAVLDHKPADSFLADMGAAQSAVMAQFTGQELSYTCWAWAKLETQPPPGWLARHADAVHRHMGRLSSQGLANVLWAYAKLRYAPSAPWIASFRSASRHLMADCSPHELAAMLYAAALMERHPGTEWLQWTEEAVRDRMESFNTQAGGGPPRASPLRAGAAPPALAQRSRPSLGLRWRQSPTPCRISPQALANCMWAYATLAYFPDEDFVDRFESVSLPLLPAFRDQELANTYWALAVLTHVPGRRWISALGAVLRSRMEGLSPSEPPALVWATVSLRCYDALGADVFAALWARLLALAERGVRLPEVCGTIGSSALLLAAEQPQRPLPALSAATAAEVLHSWEMACETTSSRFQAAVAAALRRRGLDVEMEQVCSKSRLKVDCGLRLDGRQVAVEADGPFHYSANTRQPTGHTLVRNRLLRACGWVVVPVPLYDWEARGDVALQRAAEAAGLSLPPVLQRSHQAPEQEAEEEEEEEDRYQLVRRQVAPATVMGGLFVKPAS